MAGDVISVTKDAVGLVTFVGNPLFVKVDLKSLTLLPPSVVICIPSTDLIKLGNWFDGISGKLIVICIVVSNNAAKSFQKSLVTVWFDDGGTENTCPD